MLNFTLFPIHNGMKEAGGPPSLIHVSRAVFPSRSSPPSLRFLRVLISLALLAFAPPHLSHKILLYYLKGQVYHQTDFS